MSELKGIIIFLIFVLLGASGYAITHDIFAKQIPGIHKSTILEEVQR